MAGKVNTKFVVLLASSLVVVFALGLVLFFKVVLKSGEDHIRTGDALMAEGEYEKAKRFYGMAVNKDTTRTDWLDKWVESMVAWTPETATAYRDAFYNEYVPAISQIATVQRTDVDAHADFLSLLHEQLGQGYSRGGADRLYQAATGAVSNFDRALGGVDERWPTLRRFRGFAYETALQNNAVLDEAQIELIGEDLRAALEADPSDGESAAALMRWLITSAARDLRETDTTTMPAARAEALAVGEAFREGQGEHPAVELMHLAIRLDMARDEASQGREDAERTIAVIAALGAFEPELDRLAGVLLEGGLEKTTHASLNRFQSLERAVSPRALLRRSRALLDGFITMNPESGRLIWSAALAARNTNDLVGALERLEQVSELGELPLSLEGMMRFDLRRQSLIALAEAKLDLYVQHNSGVDIGIEAPTIEEVVVLRDRFAAEISDDNVQMAMLDGRIAEVKGDMAAALRLYKRYNEQTQRRDTEGLWREGRVAMELGQTGTARTALQEVLSLDRLSIRSMLALAQIELRLQRPEAAEVLYRRVLIYDTENAIALDGLEKVRNQLNPELIDDPIAALILRARQIRSGTQENAADPAGASEFLEVNLDVVNYEPAVALELASYRADLGDIVGARRVITEAIQRHPEDDGLSVMASALENDDPTEVLFSLVEASEREEVDKLISIGSIAMSRGREDRLGSVLDSLSTLAPENPQYIDLAFVTAIRNGDLETAASLTETAVSLDVDRVRGLSYRARLESAKGNREESIRLLQQATTVGTADASIYRILGMELRDARRIDESAAAFEQALAIRPDDMQTIYEYVASLATMQRYQQALDVSRRLQRFGMTSPQFVELWLSLEANAGGDEGRALAISQREQILETNATDARNRIELARLYLQEQRWDESKLLIDQLRAERDSLGLVELEATWFADQGRVGNQSGLVLARGVYRRYIEAAGEDVGSEPFLSLARFMVGRGRADLAVQAADEAIARETPEERLGTKLKGDLLMSLGQHEGAAEMFKQLIEAGLDDEEQTYRQRLVEMYVRTRKWQDASDALALLPDAQRGAVSSMLQAAEIAAGLGDQNEQFRILDAAVAEYPTQALVFIKRAQAKLVDPTLQDDLLADIETALRLSPNDWRALRVRAASYFEVGDKSEAIKDLRAALRANPSLDDALFATMNELFALDRPAEAIDVAREVVGNRPNDAPLMSQLGKLFESREDWDSAAEFHGLAWRARRSPSDGASYIDVLVRKSPPDATTANSVINDLSELAGGIENSPGLLAAQSLVLRARGREDFAKQQMTKAFDLCVDDAVKIQSWANNAARFYAGFSIEEEVGYYQSLRARYPDADIRAWLDLFISQRTLVGQPDSAEAMSALEALIVNESAMGQTRQLAVRALGNALYQSDRYEDAVEAWGLGLEVDPDDWELNNNIAYTLARKLGRPEDALELAERAAELAPSRSEPMDTLAGVYIGLGKLDEAGQMIQLGEQRARTYAARISMTVTRARLELERGNTKEARRLVGIAETILRSVAQQDEGVQGEIELVKAQIAERMGSGG